jgi:hypothetical protein
MKVYGYWANGYMFEPRFNNSLMSLYEQDNLPATFLLFKLVEHHGGKQSIDKVAVTRNTVVVVTDENRDEYAEWLV